MISRLANRGGLRKILGGLAIVGAAAGVSLPASATSPIPTTGTCGFVLNFAYPFVYLYGSSPGTGWGMNWIGTIDFGASKISANIVLQNPAGSASTESQTSFSVPFTTSAGPVSGSYTLTFTPFTNAWTLNVIPVNGGNTVLLQGFSPIAGNQDGGSAGVCQM